MLHSGTGNEFVIRCARTESMSLKEQGKNIIQACYKGVSLALYYDGRKHCQIKNIQLRTTNSLPLGILKDPEEEIIEEEATQESNKGPRADKKEKKWRPHYFTSNIKNGSL
jgi:hypothetical protein